MLVKDCAIEKRFIEPDVPGDPFEVSDADTMLDYIKKSCKPQTISAITKPGCPFCAKADFDNTVAIHPVSAEELVTMKTPEPEPDATQDLDTGMEWRESALPNLSMRRTIAPRLLREIE